MYVRGLEFEEKPNYDMMRGKFKSVINRVHTNKKEEILTDWQVLRKAKKDEKKMAKNSNQIDNAKAVIESKVVGNDDLNLAGAA